jgi:hypothetical protein
MVPKISRKSTLMLKGHDLNLPDNTDTYWGYVLGAARATATLGGSTRRNTRTRREHLAMVSPSRPRQIHPILAY